MGRKKCAYCGKKFDKDDLTYVEGKPYCQKHYTEAESMAAIDDGYDDDADDSECDGASQLAQSPTGSWHVVLCDGHRRVDVNRLPVMG